MDNDIKKALKDEILYILREQKENPALIEKVPGLIALYPENITEY